MASSLCQTLTPDICLQHLESHKQMILKETGVLPLEIFMTMTFKPDARNQPGSSGYSSDIGRGHSTTKHPSHYLNAFERCYPILLQMLMNNYDRKRHLQPLTYAFFDKPHTGGASRSNSNRAIREDLPHLHIVMLLHPATRKRYIERRDELFSKFFVHLAELKSRTIRQDILALNQEDAVKYIDAVVASSRGMAFDKRPISGDPFLISLDEQVVGDLKKVVDYSSKLMKYQPPYGTTKDDLYTILPAW